MAVFPSFVAFEVQVQQKKTKRPALFSALPVIKCELLSCAINVRQHIVKVSTTALLSAPELLNAKYKVRQLLKINVLKWGEHSRLPCHLIAAFKAVLHRRQ